MDGGWMEGWEGDERERFVMGAWWRLEDWRAGCWEIRCEGRGT